MPARALRPFSPEPQLQGLSLTCAAQWQSGRLDLHYSLRGDLGALVLPPPAEQPARRDGLWQSTCFEAFLALPGQANYWEINLAPNGDWNLYALAGYRTGLRAERLVQQVPIRVERQVQAPANREAHGCFTLGATLDLTAWLPADAALELSATAVLDHRERGCSYWAWRHCGPEADFHRRDSLLPL